MTKKKYRRMRIPFVQPPGITGALVGRTAGQNVVTAAFFALE